MLNYAVLGSTITFVGSAENGANSMFEFIFDDGYITVLCAPPNDNATVSSITFYGLYLSVAEYTRLHEIRWSRWTIPV